MTEQLADFLFSFYGRRYSFPPVKGNKWHQVAALIIATTYQVMELKKASIIKNGLSHQISNVEPPSYP